MPAMTDLEIAISARDEYQRRMDAWEGKCATAQARCQALETENASLKTLLASTQAALALAQEYIDACGGSDFAKAAKKAKAIKEALDLKMEAEKRLQELGA